MRGILITSLFVFGLNGRAETITLTGEALRDSIVSYAQQYIGTPYLYAGVTDKGFDCSGFVYFVFKHFGITTSRSSSGYEGAGDLVENETTQAGDIILFTGTDAEIRKVGHVGIILRNDNGTIDFIHSSSSKNHFGVTITRFNDSAGYQKRFLRIINILP